MAEVSSYRIVLRLPNKDLDFYSGTIAGPSSILLARDVWRAVEHIDATQTAGGLHVQRIEQLVGAKWVTV